MPALLTGGSSSRDEEPSRRGTRDSEAPSLSYGIGASSFGELFDYQVSS